MVATQTTEDLAQVELTRDTLVRMTAALPETCDLEVVVDRLVFMAKIEQGLQQSERGDTVSLAEAKEIMDSWSR